MNENFLFFFKFLSIETKRSANEKSVPGGTVRKGWHDGGLNERKKIRNYQQ
jgi:hypothetical protein